MTGYHAALVKNLYELLIYETLSKLWTYALGSFAVGLRYEKMLRNEEGGESIFKETEKTHFSQQLLHVGENLAEIDES